MGFQTINPFNNSVIQEYEFESSEQILSKIESSHTTYLAWSKRERRERVAKIQIFNKLLVENKRMAAKLISQEMGKPIKEALAEVEKCSTMIDYYCTNADQFLRPKEIPSNFPNTYIHYCPQGIIFGVMPWNFPFWQVLRFAIPTLLIGNVVLIKHAPNVQGCQDFIQSLANQVFKNENPFETLVIDIAQIEPVIADKRIRGVSFTGSEAAGRSIAQVSAKYLKKCVLELGGSDAYIVLADAEIESAVESCIRSRFTNAGQSCVAAKRWIIDQSIYTEFLKIALEKIKLLKLGDPLDKATSLGPMARIDLKQKLCQQVKDSVAMGAHIEFGSIPVEVENNCSFAPILVANISEDQPLFYEEVFGPVAVIIKAKDKDHAISMANNSPYGLGGAIFSQDSKEATRVAIEELDTGGVFVNDFYKSAAELPFGGVKSSGIGRELSYLALYEFANIKTISVKE